jgi:hypothetical protein
VVGHLFSKKNKKRFQYLTATAQYDFIIVNTRFQKKYKKKQYFQFVKIDFG